MARSDLALSCVSLLAAVSCAAAGYLITGSGWPLYLAAALFLANALVYGFKYRRGRTMEGKETIAVVMMKDGEFKGEPPVRGKSPPGAR